MSEIPNVGFCATTVLPRLIPPVSARMPQAPVVPHTELVAFVRTRKLHGRGIGWIDVHLLASSLVGGLRLWTADPALEILADEFGVAYK